ncbi:MAG: sigma-70 family RNA polymerase sigma factor [Pseudomonadota bacterium]
MPRQSKDRIDTPADRRSSPDAKKGAGEGANAGASPPETPSRRIERLFKSDFKPLVSFLYGAFGPGPPDPEDVAQAAFARLGGAASLDHVDDLKAYLWRTARNMAVSQIRALRALERKTADVREISSDDAYYHLTPERVLRGREDVRRVAEILSRMPTRRKSAFLLVRIDGVTHAEAARRLGISRPAVSSYVAAAAAEILTALSDDDDERRKRATDGE